MMYSKIIPLTLGSVLFVLPAFAAVPNLQIQCQKVSKNQNQLRVQLENGFVYDALKITTQSSKQPKLLTIEDLQSFVVEQSFNSTVKSVTLTYQDPETQESVTLSEDVECNTQEVAQQDEVDTQSQVTVLQTLPIANQSESDVINLPSNSNELVTTVTNTVAAEQNLNADLVANTTPAPITSDADILPTDEPETSAQILGIESSIKPNPKKRFGAKYLQKNNVIEQQYDFSEDIEDF